MSSEEVLIKELDLNLIPPNEDNVEVKEQDAMRIVVIGKPGTGKSKLIESILYAKRHLIPVGLAICGTEEGNGFYNRMFPPLFVYNEYNDSIIESFIKRQKKSRSLFPNPWAVLVADDFTHDNQIIKNSKQQQDIMKNGRHYKLLYIVALQYCMDVPRSFRTSIDGTFILRNSIMADRKNIYEHYASVIPDFDTFCQLLDSVTEDYTALYIHNKTNVNDWRECVFWYKADLNTIPTSWKFGCKEYWEFNDDRYDVEADNMDR